MKSLNGKKLIIIYIAVIVVLIILIINFIFLPGVSKLRANSENKDILKAQIGDMTPLDKKIDELTEVNNGLIENIDNITSKNSNITMTREEFLVFLGGCMSNNSVDMVNFSDLGTEEENGIYKSTYDIQMRGTQKNINEILRMIDLSNIRYSIGSVSLREDGEKEYLQRYFDEYTNLEWYTMKTPDPTEEPIETVIPTIEPEEFEQMPENNIFYYEEEIPVYTQPPVIMTPIPQPEPIPTDEIPSENKENENISDRLNKLLEQTSYKNKYKLRFVTNNDNYSSIDNFSEYSEDEKMLLNITIQFIMYQNPQESDNNILNYIDIIKTGGETDELL